MLLNRALYEHICNNAKVLFTKEESIRQTGLTSPLSVLFLVPMCAMYKPAVWQFTDSAVRSSYDSMPSPIGPDWLVMRSQDRSNSGSKGRAVARVIGECFSISLCEELESRDLPVQRIAIRTVTSTERFRGGNGRTRVELDVIVDVPKATPNQLIDALCAAKRRSVNVNGATVKILMKAELKTSRSVAGCR
jgi:hypothetical protein